MSKNRTDTHAKPAADPLVRETTACLDCGAALSEPGRVRCEPCRTSEDLLRQVEALTKRWETEHAATAEAAKAMEAERYSAAIVREELDTARSTIAALEIKAAGLDRKYRAQRERYVAMAMTLAERVVKEGGR